MLILPHPLLLLPLRMIYTVVMKKRAHVQTSRRHAPVALRPVLEPQGAVSEANTSNTSNNSSDDDEFLNHWLQMLTNWRITVKKTTKEIACLKRKVMYLMFTVSLLLVGSIFFCSSSSDALATVTELYHTPLLALHICRETFPNSTSRKIDYFCEGTAYENFTKRLLQYALLNKSTTWGRRENPVPSNKTVLMIGNSHTRQVFNAIRCQYAQQIVRSEDYQDVYALTKNIPSAWHFGNNSTMVVVYNSPYVYNKENWTQTMEMVLRQPIYTFDAVVMGRFNGFETKSNKSNFGKELLNFSLEHPGYFDSSFTPPTIERFSQVYHGPILAVTMFAAYGQDVKESAVKAQMQRNISGNEIEIVVVDARKHIEAMGEECGSDSLREVGQCLNTEKDNNRAGRAPRNMHRCVGKSGGHPDLVAWDVIEGLYRLFPA